MGYGFKQICFLILVILPFRSKTFGNTVENDTFMFYVNKKRFFSHLNLFLNEYFKKLRA